MKKKIVLIGILILAVLFFSSCKKRYTAWVTILNDGDILITVSVEDETESIPAGESVTWEINWEGDRFTTVHLYAEPFGFNDFDEAYVTLENNEEYTWVTGWVYVAQSLTKKAR